MVQINFNATGVKPNAALEALPSGMYPVVITATEDKPTKTGNGSYIQFEMQVQAAPGVDPAHVGRKFYDRLNINNPNQTAVDIAYATLSAICHVTGVMQLQDTQQLHGRPFMVVVSKRVRDDLPPPPAGEQPQYTNEVKGYKDVNGNDPGFAGTQQSGGQNGGGQPQWANNGGGQPQQQVQQQQPVQAAQQQNNGGQPAWANGGGGQQPQQPQQANNSGGAPSWAQPQQGQS